MEKTISEDIATTKLRIKLCMTVYKMRDLEKETHLKGRKGWRDKEDPLNPLR